MNKYQEALKRLEGIVLTSPFKNDGCDGVVDMNDLYKCGTQLQNEYLHDLNVLKELVDKAESFEWIPFTFDEEGVLNCELPDVDEEILVSDGDSVWQDTWCEADEGYELYSGIEIEDLAWRQLPKPYEDNQNENNC